MTIAAGTLAASTTSQHVVPYVFLAIVGVAVAAGVIV